MWVHDCACVALSSHVAGCELVGVGAAVVSMCVRGGGALSRHAAGLLAACSWVWVRPYVVSMCVGGGPSSQCWPCVFVCGGLYSSC